MPEIRYSLNNNYHIDGNLSPDTTYDPGNLYGSRDPPDSYKYKQLYPPTKRAGTQDMN